MIAVFTKFDQFRRDIRMKVEDQDRNADDPAIVNAEMERVVKEEFLAHLKGSTPIVRLESEDFFPTSIYYTNNCPKGMHKQGERCTDLIKTTADTLSGNVVALMLLTVQKDNLELSIEKAVEW